jgi:hypothetical protein
MTMKILAVIPNHRALVSTVSNAEIIGGHVPDSRSALLRSNVVYFIASWRFDLSRLLRNQIGFKGGVWSSRIK